MVKGGAPVPPLVAKLPFIFVKPLLPLCSNVALSFSEVLSLPQVPPPPFRLFTDVDIIWMLAYEECLLLRLVFVVVVAAAAVAFGTVTVLFRLFVKAAGSNVIPSSCDENDNGGCIVVGVGCGVSKLISLVSSSSCAGVVEDCIVLRPFETGDLWLLLL